MKGKTLKFCFTCLFLLDHVPETRQVAAALVLQRQLRNVLGSKGKAQRSRGPGEILKNLQLLWRTTRAVSDFLSHAWIGQFTTRLNMGEKTMENTYVPSTMAVLQGYIPTISCVQRGECHPDICWLRCAQLAIPHGFRPLDVSVINGFAIYPQSESTSHIESIFLTKLQ
jgi:hypothetical protein